MREEGREVPKASAAGFYPTYYSPSEKRIRNIDFTQPHARAKQSDVDRLTADELLGASVVDTALYKSKHLEAAVFEELTESIKVIEEKYHAGMFDAQAMPLVEELINELENLAKIQLERNAVNDCRINDIKQAKAAAYDAVYEARKNRELSIEAARIAHIDSFAPDFEEIEVKEAEKERKRARRTQARQEKRLARERQREDRKAKKAEAQKRREKENARKEDERSRRHAQKEERIRKRQEVAEQRRQLKLEKERERQHVIAQKAQNRVESLQRKEGEKRAASLLKRAQAEADIEQAKAATEKAKADLEKARAEAGKARLEELEAQAARAEHEASVGSAQAEDVRIEDVQPGEVPPEEAPMEETQPEETRSKEEPAEEVRQSEGGDLTDASHEDDADIDVDRAETEEESKWW